MDDPKRLPGLYRFFESNIDRIAAFFVATLIPIAATWPVALCDPGFKPYWGWVYLGLFVGQGLLVAFVSMGTWMVWWHSSRFSKHLGKVTAAVVLIRSRDEFDDSGMLDGLDDQNKD